MYFCIGISPNDQLLVEKSDGNGIHIVSIFQMAKVRKILHIIAIRRNNLGIIIAARAWFLVVTSEVLLIIFDILHNRIMFNVLMS